MLCEYQKQLAAWYLDVGMPYVSTSYSECCPPLDQSALERMANAITDYRQRGGRADVAYKFLNEILQAIGESMPDASDLPDFLVEG